MATETILRDEYVPVRTPAQPIVGLTATAIDLGGASGTSVTSDAGFDLWSASDWYIGTSTGQARLVAAGEAYSVPSSSLSGWWAKSSSGTISLVVTAANKAG